MVLVYTRPNNIIMKIFLVLPIHISATLSLSPCSLSPVVNRRHVYTSWEGDPAAAVENSKHASRSTPSVFSSPTSSIPATPSPTSTDDHVIKSSSQESLDQKMDDSVFIRTTPECNEQGSGDEVTGSVCGTRSTTDQPPDHFNNLEVERGGDNDVTISERVQSTRNTHTADGSCKNEDQTVCMSEQEHEKMADVDSLRTHHGLLIYLSLSLTSSSSLCTAFILPHSSPAAPSSDTTKSPASVATSHKGRSPFSRKFATPIVVTHTRRSFSKPLPKHLDPKSTVTLLLSSSNSPTAQQKHNKHKNQKFKRQFSPPRHLSEAALEENSCTVNSSSLSSSLLLRMKGREKDRELWKKRHNSASSSAVSCSREQSKNSELGKEDGRTKRSPEELSAIQSRVRESLRAQGVVG